MATKRIFNLEKQTPDPRDYSLMMSVMKEGEVKLPISVDLRSKCPPVFDQKSLGSCTANAGCSALSMLLNTKKVFSRIFLYYKERELEGTIQEDAGASMRDIGKAIKMFGVCGTGLQPYWVSRFKNPPSQKAIDDASKYKIGAYYSVYGVEGIKGAVALRNQPVMIGFYVYESFMGDVESTGIMVMPQPNEQILGGHAVMICGYNDTTRQFICRNSWGASWGIDGYFMMPYEYVEKGLAFDFWVLQ